MKQLKCRIFNSEFGRVAVSSAIFKVFGAIIQNNANSCQTAPKYDTRFTELCRPLPSKRPPLHRHCAEILSAGKSPLSSFKNTEDPKMG